MMIMNPKNKVKLVKRSQTGKPAEAEGKTDADAQSKVDRQAGDDSGRPEASKRTTREIASRVASWVNEFQHRRPSDPRTSFAKLFTENPEPLKSF
jgi:hypothetical protein